MLDAVVAPGPHSPESKLLHAVWRAGPFVKGIAAVDDAQILKQSFEGRRIKRQTGKFDAVAVDVQDNSFLSRNDQPAQDSKLWGFPSKKLDDTMRIFQWTRIDNHCNQFSE